MPEAVPEMMTMMTRQARAAMIGLIGGYHRFISPILPPSCRFLPCCSEYGILAVGKYGIIRGTGLAMLRILRCQPFARGGYDPVR